MSSNDIKPNPYADFFEDKSKNEVPTPSEEFQKTDRGQPELKVEQPKSLKENRNIIIAIGLVVITILLVGFFIFKLMSRFGTENVVENVIIDNALEKEAQLSIASAQSKIDAANKKEAEAARLLRERLAREAAERLERETSERLEREATETGQKENTKKLGRFSGSSAEGRSQSSNGQNLDELTKEQRDILKSRTQDVMAYESSNKQSSNKEHSNNIERPSLLGNMLMTERHANGTAYVRASREYLLMRGTSIPCTLLPRVVTNYASQPTCMVNEDVYSPEGIVLIERGSKVLGEQRIAMKAGVSKVFIAWADIETPAGVSVSIDSMGADQLGGSGIDAWIDNHYAQRFGGAILLSFIDDLSEIASSKIAKTEYNFEQSSDNASSMAQIVLENSINIKPTGYIMPATQTTILVARDVDFTHIYKVR